MTAVFMAKQTKRNSRLVHRKCKKFLSVHKHKISTHDLITKIDAIAFFCTVVITVPQLKYFFKFSMAMLIRKYAKNGLIFLNWWCIYQTILIIFTQHALYWPIQLQVITLILAGFVYQCLLYDEILLIITYNSKINNE